MGAFGYRKFVVSLGAAVLAFGAQWAMAQTSGGSSQSDADRCAAALALLSDPGDLTQIEIDFFTEILESPACDGVAVPVREGAASQTPADIPDRASGAATSAGKNARGDETPPVEKARPAIVYPDGPFTVQDCRNASRRIASYNTMQERNSDAAKIQLHIYQSGECAEWRARRSAELSAEPGIAQMEALLESRGIDLSQRVSEARARCESAAPEGPARTSCIANARQAAYSAAIIDLQNDTAAQYNRDMAAYREKVAEVEQRKRDIAAKAAADKAAHERRMAEWRRAVRLCNEGQHEYCQAVPEE